MRKILALVFLLAGVTAMPALAQDKEIDALKAVLAEGALDPELFSAEFLKAVPAAQLEPSLAGIKATIGPVLDIRPGTPPNYLVETATHEMSSDIVLDAAGRITGLFFRPPSGKNTTIEESLAEIEAVAPHFAYLITRDGVTLHAGGGDAALAVGSAFKLGVLKALRDQIDAGAHRWDEVVRLEAGDISLPSGMIQGWPPGAPLTLHSLASLMISISDNTATDTLMRVVGRDAVEAALGIAPALTTRELFTLKTDRDLLARYQAGDLAAQRAVLVELASQPLPSGAGLSPHDQGAEWYVPPTRLCALIDAVGDLDVMSINPGVANKADWARVAFKGGSETGVLNLTTQLTAGDGARYCVAISWNDDKAIDESKATAAVATLLAILARS